MWWKARMRCDVKATVRCEMRRDVMGSEGKRSEAKRAKRRKTQEEISQANQQASQKVITYLASQQASQKVIKRLSQSTSKPKG